MMLYVYLNRFCCNHLFANIICICVCVELIVSIIFHVLLYFFAQCLVLLIDLNMSLYHHDHPIHIIHDTMKKNIIPPRSYGKTCYEAQLISPKKKNNKHMRKSDDLHMTHIIFPKMLLIMISSTYISDIVMHFLCINHQHQELNLPNDMYIITCI